MRELDKIASELFDKIRSRFEPVRLDDESGKPTENPELARFYNFDYTGNNGKNFGNIQLSIVDEVHLKVNYGSNITDALDDVEQEEWYDFLRSLRKFARRNGLIFDNKDINRSNLTKRDIKQQAGTDATYDKTELAIAEGRLYGIGNNRRVSFGDIGTHKLIIKHSDQIDPDKRGDRARRIENIFIETPVGERFLLPYNNLDGARALANYMRYGGNFGDEGAALISEMVNEMASMRHFVRAMRNRTFEDQETTGMVEAAIHRYNEVRDHLKRFQGRRGQELLIDMLSAQHNVEEEIDIEEMRERFVKKIYDDRFTEALPYVYRAYQERKKSNTAESEQFESWATDVTEATWDADSDDVDEANLTRLFAEPIAAGMDGIDAGAIISDIEKLNSDDLKNSIKKLAAVHGPDVDTRNTIIGWLMSNGERDLAQNLLQTMQQQNANTQPAPTQPQPQPQPVGASTMDEPVVSEDLLSLRKLAGL